MAAPPFALSIHHFISSVGADAGFAAIIGLALLVLLHFTQARETATLRRRADEAEEQLQRLGQYVDQLARQRPTVAPAPAGADVPAPAPAPAPAAARLAGRPMAAPVVARTAAAAAGATMASSSPAAAPAGAAAAIPAAPAGVGAPALSAATRLIPPPAEGSPRNAGAESNGHAPLTSSSVAVAEPKVAVGAPAAPPPATAAGAANGTQVAAASAPAAPALAPAARRPRVTPEDAARPTPPPPPPPFQRGSLLEADRRRWRRPLGIAASVLAVAVAVVVVLIVGGSGSNTPSSSGSPVSARSSGTHDRSTGRPQTAAGVVPSTVTVAVLNGTTSPGLAAAVATRLTRTGYKKGNVTNAASQAVGSTVIGYTRSTYRRDAQAVARALSLAAGAVQPVSSGDLGAACGAQASTCPDQVVVTVGANLAPKT